MESKIQAATLASVGGVKTVLVNGKNPERILDYLTKLSEVSVSTEGAGASSVEQRNEYSKKASGSSSVGEKPSSVEQVAESLTGTFFQAAKVVSSLKSQRRWILALPPVAKIFINEGAAAALFRKKSLLAAGIVRVEGRFFRHDCVQILLDNLGDSTAGDPFHGQDTETDYFEEDASPGPRADATAGSTITTPRGRSRPRAAGEQEHEQEEDASSKKARTLRDASARSSTESNLCGAGGAESRVLAQALVTYTSADVEKIVGLRSDEIPGVLGYVPPEIEVCHRQNIILIGEAV